MREALGSLDKLSLLQLWVWWKGTSEDTGSDKLEHTVNGASRGHTGNTSSVLIFIQLNHLVMVIQSICNFRPFKNFKK
jgi:hypothetical protein